MATQPQVTAMTIRQYSQLTGLHIMTCYRQAREGKLPVPARRYLGRWLVFLPRVEEKPADE
jgi:predicted site-specific integrase-resolvase